MSDEGPEDAHLPDHVFRWIEAAERRVARDLEPHLGERERALWPRRLRILEFVPPGGIRQTDLASRALITKQALGALIESLEAEGLVERSVDPTDARAWLVRLSPAGQKITASFERALDRVERDLAADVGPDDYDAFKRVLRRLGRGAI